MTTSTHGRCCFKRWNTMKWTDQTNICSNINHIFLIVLRTYYGLCLCLGLALFPTLFNWFCLSNFGNAVFIGWGQDIWRNDLFFFDILFHFTKNILIHLCHWSSQVLPIRLFFFDNFLRFLFIFAYFSLFERLFLIRNLELIIYSFFNVLLVAKLERRLSTGCVEVPIGEICHEADEEKSQMLKVFHGCLVIGLRLLKL